MEQTTASVEAAAVAAAVLASLGPVAVVRMVPVAVHDSHGARRRTHVTLWDADGLDLTERIDQEGHALARDAVRAAFPGRVWDRAVDYAAASGVLSPVTALRTPPVPLVTVVPVPLGEAFVPDAEGGAL